MTAWHVATENTAGKGSGDNCDTYHAKERTD